MEWIQNGNESVLILVWYFAHARIPEYIKSHPELGDESTTQHENNQDIQSINEKKAFCNNYDINKFLLKSHKMYKLMLLLLVSDILQMWILRPTRPAKLSNYTRGSTAQHKTIIKWQKSDVYFSPYTLAMV